MELAKAMRKGITLRLSTFIAAPVTWTISVALWDMISEAHCLLHLPSDRGRKVNVVVASSDLLIPSYDRCIGT